MAQTASQYWAARKAHDSARKQAAFERSLRAAGATGTMPSRLCPYCGRTLTHSGYCPAPILACPRAYTD